MSCAALYRIGGEPAMLGGEAHQAPLRFTLVASPEARVQALAVVQACCPAPHRVDVLGRDSPGDANAVLFWWRLGDDQVLAVATRHAQAVEIPLIALCGAGADDQAAALDAGADAACGLPVQPRLLRALITAYQRALARRALAAAPSASVIEEGRSEPLGGGAGATGPIRINRRAHTCEVNGETLDLTLKEFRLLAYFLEHKDACCSRDELLEQVWGLDFDPGSNSVDVFVYTLRRKLKARGLVGVIQTVRGVGYRLVSPPLST